MRTTSVMMFLSPRQGSTDSVTTAVFTAPANDLAWMVYALASTNVVHVPEILPVLPSSLIPAGSAGDTVKS